MRGRKRFGPVRFRRENPAPVYIPYIRLQTIPKSENHSKLSFSSLGLLTFSALSIADGLTTAIGLSRGLQETETLATFLLSNFGLQGFLLFKITIGVVVAALVLVYGERVERSGDFGKLFYFSASASLLFIAAAPVINNLILLGWI